MCCGTMICLRVCMRACVHVPFYDFVRLPFSSGLLYLATSEARTQTFLFPFSLCLFLILTSHSFVITFNSPNLQISADLIVHFGISSSPHDLSPSHQYRSPPLFTIYLAHAPVFFIYSSVARCFMVKGYQVCIYQTDIQQVDDFSRLYK